jgi:hypothetical protein
MERLVEQLASFVGGASSRLGSRLDISCVLTYSLRRNIN